MRIPFKLIALMSLVTLVCSSCGLAYFAAAAAAGGGGGDDGPAPLEITTTSPLTEGKEQYAYTGVQLEAKGGTQPYTWTTVGSGQLPPGMSMNSSGYISGTPTTKGVYNFTAQVMDSTSRSAQQAYAITIQCGIIVTTNSSLTDGRVGFAYSATLEAENGAAGYAWALYGGTSLPAGLSLTNAGVIQGTPTSAGSTNFQVQVTDSDSKTDTGSFSLTIKPGLTVTTQTLNEAEYNVAYYGTFEAVNGQSPYTWSLASGTLPSGLTINSNGSITGTPGQVGDFNFTVQVTDNLSNTDQQALSLHVKETTALTVISVSPSVLGEGNSSRIKWKSTRGGNYTVEVGSGGVLGCGTTINLGATGACAPGIPVDTYVLEDPDLPDNQSSKVWIFVEVTGSSEILCASTTLYDDQTPPASLVTKPSSGQELGGLTFIEGNASDAGGGSVATVELSIMDNSSGLYWGGTDFDCSVEAWYVCTGAGLWTYNASSILLTNAVNYVIRTRATDSVGNVETPGTGSWFRADTNVPVVTITEHDPYVIGEAMTSIIKWKADKTGTYTLEIGGDGTTGSGTLIENGSCTAGVEVTSYVFEDNVTDNTEVTVYVIVDDGSRSGYALTEITDDHTPPTSLTTYPINGSETSSVTNITGTAYDNGGSYVESVRISIYNGTSYYNGASFSSSNEVLLTTSYLGSWNFNAASIPWSDGTMYYVRSYAADNVANTESTPTVTQFTYNLAAEPPAKVTGPFPEDGENAVAVDTSLSWTPATGATSYDVYLGPEGDLQYKGNFTDTSYTPASELDYLTTYQWRIDAKGPGGITPGDTWSFTTIIEKPGAITYVSPSDGKKDISITPTLNWSPANRAELYDIYLGTSNPPTTLVKSDHAATSYNHTTSLSYLTTYYWQILAKNDGGETSGEVWSFKTVIEPPAAPSPFDPASGTTGVDITDTLDWGDSARADGYHVYFGASATPPFAETTAISEYVPSGDLSSGTTYYWQVIAYNTGGNSSAASGYFVTAAAPVADFTENATSGYAPLHILFGDRSSGSITGWEWDFDNDGSVDSTQMNPSYTYSTPGTYSVTLTVEGPGGEDSLTKMNHIQAYDSQPTLTVTSPDNDSHFNSSFTVHGTAIDYIGISDVQYSDDGGGSWYTVDNMSSLPSWSHTVDLYSWPYDWDSTFEIWFRASNGTNTSDIYELTFTRDMTSPDAWTNIYNPNSQSPAEDLVLDFSDDNYDFASLQANIKVYEIGCSTNLAYSFDWDCSNFQVRIVLIGENNGDILKSSTAYNLDLSGCTDLAGNPINMVDGWTGDNRAFTTRDYVKPRVLSIAFGLNNSDTWTWNCDKDEPLDEVYAPFLFDPSVHIDNIAITFDEKMETMSGWCGIEYAQQDYDYMQVDLWGGNAGFMYWTGDCQTLVTVLFNSDPPDGVRLGSGYAIEFEFGDLNDQSWNWIDYIEFTVLCSRTDATDTTGPQVLGLHPYYDGQTDGPVSPGEISIQLSEMVDPSTIDNLNIVLKVNGDEKDCLLIYENEDMGGAPPIYMVYNDDFPLGANVEVLVQNLKDISGNSMPSAQSFNFQITTTADTTAPSVTFVTPLPFQDKVPPAYNDLIGIVLDDECIDPDSLDMNNIYVHEKGNTTVIKGFRFQLDDSDWLVEDIQIRNDLLYDGPFLANATYVVEISGIKDYSGNQMPTYSWEFTMGTDWEDWAPGDGRHDNPDVDYTPLVSPWNGAGDFRFDCFLNSSDMLHLTAYIGVSVQDYDYWNGDMVVLVDTGIDNLTLSEGYWGGSELVYETPDGENDFDKFGTTGLVTLTVRVFENNVEELTWTVDVYIPAVADMPQASTPVKGDVYRTDQDIPFAWTNNIGTYENIQGIAILHAAANPYSEPEPLLMFMIPGDITSYSLPAGVLPAGEYIYAVLENHEVPGYGSETMGVPFDRYNFNRLGNPFVVYDPSLGCIHGTVTMDQFTCGSIIIAAAPDLFGEDPNFSGNQPILDSPGPYTIYNLEDNSYQVFAANYFKGYFDAPAKNEPLGVYTVGLDVGNAVISGGGNASGIDINIKPSYLGVWGTSATDVYVCGQLGNVCHFNGSVWSPMNSGTGTCLTGIWGEDNMAIYSPGYGGSIRKYTGSWAGMTSPTTNNLHGIWGGVNGVFCVGENGTAMSLSGSTWSLMNTFTNASLYGVHTTNGNMAWACGENGTTLLYDYLVPGVWTNYPTNSANTFEATWMYSGEAYSVGGNASAYELYMGLWQEMVFSYDDELKGLFGFPGTFTTLYAVGDGGGIYLYDGIIWTEMASDNVIPLYAVWGENENSVFAVGAMGTVMYYDGAGWTYINP